MRGSAFRKVPYGSLAGHSTLPYKATDPRVCRSLPRWQTFIVRYNCHANRDIVGLRISKLQSSPIGNRPELGKALPLPKRQGFFVPRRFNGLYTASATDGGRWLRPIHERLRGLTAAIGIETLASGLGPLNPQYQT